MPDNARILEIARELQGLSDELGELNHESAALMRRGIDTALRYAPHPPVAGGATQHPDTQHTPMAVQPDLQSMIRAELQEALRGLLPQYAPTDRAAPGGG